MGKMLLGISFVLSKQYSDHLSEMVLRGQRRTLEEGKSIHVAKHGYYKDPNGYLRPDGEYWVLIKQAFQMRADGKTQEEVAEFLNKSRYSRYPTEGKARVAYRATVNKVSMLLRDPTYAGVHMYGNSIVNLNELYDFEPAVSVETFLSINQLSDIGAAFKMVKPMKKRGAVKADFLRGLVYCSFCNKRMAATETGKVNKSKGTSKIFYYRCETKGCERKKKSLRGYVVMQYVLDFLADHLFATKSNYQQFCKTVQEESVQKQQEIESRLMSLRRAKTENKKTEERVKNLLLENDKTVIEYFRWDMAKVEQEAVGIAKEIAENEALLAKAKEAPITYETFLELFKNVAKNLQESGDLGWRDQTIRLFFSNFVVDEQKVANFGLCQPFSDFLEQGDFLNGRAGGTRTRGLLLPKQARYQLRHGPMSPKLSVDQTPPSSLTKRATNPPD